MFEFELVPVGDVLVLAAGTLGVELALRFDPVRRRRADADEVGVGEAFADVDDFDFDAFAGEDEGNEDDDAFKAPDAVATKGDVDDVDFEMLAGLQSHALVLRGTGEVVTPGKDNLVGDHGAGEGDRHGEQDADATQQDSRATNQTRHKYQAKHLPPVLADFEFA